MDNSKSSVEMVLEASVRMVVKALQILVNQHHSISTIPLSLSKEHFKILVIQHHILIQTRGESADSW